ncbi:protein tyrosine phosphatase receptor type C-associated protein [Notechis scutatus]|uniref:Protein tyrosine phosphatase receptor type C-associated protein n=1 Tax=Notechis scutatus TaxID=8663 RepID=A0A6J1TTW8_9SAUR|nr:protein tyrosine phosphatase receptor type C-associated protein [Notechis scutatus]
MMKLRLSHILLLLLPGKIQAENPDSGRGNNGDAAVTVLICLLFLLLLVLCIAWHYLNRVTEGRYHPRHLMSNLVLWWQQFRRETLSEDLAEDYQDEEQNDGELEEERQQHVEDGGEEEDEEMEEEEKKQLLQEEEEKLTKEANEEAALEEALEEGEVSKAAQGSAEVLLSQLHSFSGTASWEDSGKSLSDTAL